MSTKVRQRRRVRSAANQAEDGQPILNTTLHADAAGIDIGAEEFVVAVPPGRCTGDTVRSQTRNPANILGARAGSQGFEIDEAGEVR